MTQRGKEMEGTCHRVGELARLCGVNRRTVDFYTNVGLLDPVMRSAGGHRFYGEDAIHRLRVIKVLRSQGMHLDAIRAQLASEGNTVDLLSRVAYLQAEMQRVSEEVVAHAPLGAANAGDRPAIRATLATAASVALTFSQELLKLLNDLGGGPL